MDEIEQLVNEYNANEQAQRERLIRLLDLLRARTGPRRVEFSSNGDSWGTNQFNLDLRSVAIAATVDKHIRLITSVSSGDPA
jgi:hypothetical protein